MSTYTPSPGSKVAAAFAAMLDGPQTIAALATVMNTTRNSVAALLAIAVKHAAVLHLQDETGLRHYALAGMPVDERYKAVGGGKGTSRNAIGRELTDAPLVRRVTRHAPPSADAIAAANPFRTAAARAPKKSAPATGSMTASKTRQARRHCTDAAPPQHHQTRRGWFCCRPVLGRHARYPQRRALDRIVRG